MHEIFVIFSNEKIHSNLTLMMMNRVNELKRQNEKKENFVTLTQQFYQVTKKGTPK